MAATTFIEFLEWAEAYHQELHDFYAERAEEAMRPEVTMLLQYMTRHEDIIYQLIAQYEKEAPKDVLDAWLTISPDLSAVKHPEEAEFRADMTTNEVIDKALELDDSLIDVYRMLRREAMSDDLKEAIEDLLEEEEREEVKLMRSQLLA